MPITAAIGMRLRRSAYFLRWEPAEKEVQLSKYENWPGYKANLPFVLRRYCGLWGRGT